MKKRSRHITGFIILMLVIILSGSILFSCSSDRTTRIKINSCLVRDRVIPLDSIKMRSMIIVAFRILPKTDNLKDLYVGGELYHNDKLISTEKISNLDSMGNNLGFDIPLSQGNFNYNKSFSIPEGRYLIIVNLFDGRHNLIAQRKKELKRKQLGRRFFGFNKVREQPRYLKVSNVEENLQTTFQKRKPDALKNKDYIIFRKNYLERVYPNTEPDASEYITAISAEISRDEYQTLTFSLRALKNLGKVQITVTPLQGAHGILDADSLTIGAVGCLTEAAKKGKDTNIIHYRQAPKIIESGDVTISQGCSRRYWLTLKAGADAVPGDDYHGFIAIKPQFGHSSEIPIHVRVLPLRLTDTDIQYGMMMTYAFYEMDNDLWTKREKALIKQRGLEIYKDFREHGMTMIYPHSCFYFKRQANGRPELSSLKAGLEGYKKFSFPGPFCWYLGHLLQTAKPFHPGSIVNYDARAAKIRLRCLLDTFETMAKELEISRDKLVVQLVDEPDRRDRIAAGKALNGVAREMGFKTLITRKWPEVDIICTSAPDTEEEAQKLRKKGKQWWIYPNSTLTTKNRAYIRYVFGFGAWCWGVDGVVPWTFQMSQGCSGNPFTVLDGSEVMAAYPGIDGPVPTPAWEIIRNGINDYKYIYLLEKLISAEKAKNNPAASIIEQKLKQFKKYLGRGPCDDEHLFGDWEPGSFTKRRKQIIEWALELYQIQRQN